MYKRILSVIMSIMMMLAIMSPLSINAENTSLKQMFADNIVGEIDEEEYEITLELLDEMSIDELNQLILELSGNSNSNERATNVPTGNVQLAWMAAAEIAESNGYPCAAALVRASVSNAAYSEPIPYEGICRPKIQATDLYKNYVTAMKQGLSVPSSLEFTKAVNSDLFYALHNVSISYGKTGTGNLCIYTITVHDVFDFEKDNDYDDLFTTLVNNWAWLCQQTGVLNPVTVDIYFVE